MIERAFLVPGMAVREFRTEVPLNWRDPSDGRRLTLFARELCAPGREADEMPCLLFLQGAPAGNARVRSPAAAGWRRRCAITG
ncbi:hypothetical protein MAY91_08005 [Edwardsiella ictaluri]|uniref:Uncharacterized protein n=1 Tax=Edwardsiella ictaluri TaxID=67780 RepID=A0ABY8GKR4_EDWIC|nr:hypothetical protein [Edwardsiella ictaluri]WFN97863.1 hypothetical protein MAY91_08005 [Edwardsiella ictaluri]